MNKVQEAIRLLEAALEDKRQLSQMREAGELHGQNVASDLDDQIETLQNVLNELYKHW